MGSRLNRLVGVLIAGSMFVSSTGAVAATSAAPQINPWAALAAMTGGAPAAALCGSVAVAAAAAQAPSGCVFPAQDVAQTAPPPPPIPVPPVEAAGGGLSFDPLLLALGVLAAGALLYFLVLRKHHAVSPA